MSWNINGLVNGILAFGEILLCYVWLCEVIIEREFLRIKDKAILVSSIILLSTILMMNRTMVFVSYVLVIITIFITSLSVYLIVKRKLLTIIATVATYYLIISLINIFFAFISMSFLQEKFDSEVYYYASSIWKNCIYFFSLIIVALILHGLMKKISNGGRLNIETYTNVLIILDVCLYIIWRLYQITMDRMALGEQEIAGVTTGFSLLSVASIVGVVGIIFLKYKVIEEENRNYLLRDNIYKSNLVEVENFLEQSRQMTHDVKNHFLIIKEMGEKNNISELLKYVDELCNEYSNTKNRIWTGNQIIDLILNQKKAIAEQKAIRFDIYSMLLPCVQLSDVELCSIFGNLLDNSLEACELCETDYRFINVNIKSQNELLFICITNGMACEPVYKNGRFITSKNDKHIHGYGLKSVERIVNKYEGTISYQTESNYFEVTITFFDMLNNAKRSEGR